MIKLRASALPLAFKCAGSVRSGQVEINATNEAADLGTAAHEGLATLVTTGRVDWDAVPALAAKYGVEEIELRVLLANGAKLWNSKLPDSEMLVRDCFPDATTEVAFSAELPC